MKSKDAQKIIERLLQSEEPCVRWKTRALVLRESYGEGMKELQEDLLQSASVKALLRGLHAGGQGGQGGTVHIYEKWQGIHWILASLADIGYPAGMPALRPYIDKMLDHWLSPSFYKEFTCDNKAASYRQQGVPLINGLYRRCAAQQGNALWVALKFGVEDARVEALVERLLHWQWPDGGWNCDRDPAADSSSFMETLIPLRALALYARLRKADVVSRAVERAAEVFLKRKMFLRLRDGAVMNPQFVNLHYPVYWHYDILAGLKVMAEAGFAGDKRCRDALDLLEKKGIRGSGWPAEERYYTPANPADKGMLKHGTDVVNWGPTGLFTVNEWVTVDAMYVLSRAGR